MLDTKTYKCPKCGTELTFDSVNQIFRCQNCNAKFALNTKKKEEQINKLIQKLKTTKINNNDLKEKKIEIELSTSKTCYELLKRSDVNMKIIENFIPIPDNETIKEQVEIAIKYEGYINKTYRDVERMLKLESKRIPQDIDYDKIKNIASEAKQKLKIIKPESLGQAARISGVNPSDLSILAIYLKKEYGKNE